MTKVDELEVFYQLKINMQALAKVDAQELYERLKDFSESEKQDSVEAVNQRKEIAAYEKAMENFVDAYLLYAENNKCGDEIIGNEIRKKLLKAVEFNPSDKQKQAGSLENIRRLKEMLSAPELAFLADKEQNEALEKLIKSVELSQKTTAELAALDNAGGGIDTSGINELVKQASKINLKQKKETSQKKSDTAKLARIKNFIIEEYKLRMAKKTALSPEENHVLQNIENISGAQIYVDGKNQYLRAPVDDKHAAVLLFKTYKNSFVFGNTPEDLAKKSKVMEVYNLLNSSDGIEFVRQEKSEGKTSGGLKEKDFNKLVGAGDLSGDEAKSAAYQEELKAYNIFLSAGKNDKAEELLQKLREKYAFYNRAAKKQKLAAANSDLEQIIKLKAKILQSSLSDKINALPPREIISLIAPGCGENAAESSKRQKFSGFLMALNGRNGAGVVQSLQSQLVRALKTDHALWNDVSENYYDKIKARATDNFYKVLSEQLFSGEKTVKQALDECRTTVSKPLAKLILFRSTELYALGNVEVAHLEKMDEIHRELGFHIRRKEFTIDKTNGLKSKPLTAMLRCLADGFKLDFTPPRSNLNAVDRQYLQNNAKKAGQILGEDRNYQPLIGKVLEGQETDGKLNVMTPYKKQYKTVGLLACLSKEMDSQAAEDALFSKYVEVPAGSNIELLKKKHSWKKDDFLFVNYMEIFFDKSIALDAKETIEAMKTAYGWDEFKKMNSARSQQIVKEFKENASDPENLAAHLLVKGEWPGKTSVHHNSPLKYAVSSANPLIYNDGKNMAVTMLWNPWEDDSHKLEHLATLEGIECAAPYLMKEGSRYVRRMQCDLVKGAVICYEKPQIADENGRFRDLIPEETLLMTSSGCLVSYPELPACALEYEKSLQKAALGKAGNDGR